MKSMRAAEKIAQEVYQVYTSGKNGVALEVDHYQDWELVVDALQQQYFPEKVVLTVRNGPRLRSGKEDFLPQLYQRHLPRCACTSRPERASLRPVVDEELETAQPESYLALALRKYGVKPGVGMIVVEAFHLLPREIQMQAARSLLQILNREAAAMIVLTAAPETSGDIRDLPEALLPYVYRIKGRKPDYQELLESVEAALAKRELTVETDFKGEIVSYLQGFQCREVEYLFLRAEQFYGLEAFGAEKKLLDLISSEKVKLLEREQLLEWKIVRHVELANMDVLKTHLRESGIIMGRLEDAEANGVDVPKGILIMGLPGTGKSLFAQYAAAQLQMPLLRLDMGKMMGGHVGDSERNLRRAQCQAEEMAPCILWIDEIEKGFAGSGGQREEGAYLRRMTGSFLTWLQEKKNSCYIIATANSIDGLPPEFFRKGRFDECFYTAMPTEDELREILKVHLRRPGRSHVETEIDAAIAEVLSAAYRHSRFMTGADASVLVSNTFRRLYIDYVRARETSGLTVDKHAYDRQHLKEVMLQEFQKIKVFSETNGDELAEYSSAARKSNFVNTSVQKELSVTDLTATSYDRRLRDFITQREDKTSEISKISK